MIYTVCDSRLKSNGANRYRCWLLLLLLWQGCMVGWEGGWGSRSRAVTYKWLHRCGRESPSAASVALNLAACHKRRGEDQTPQARISLQWKEISRQHWGGLGERGSGVDVCLLFAGSEDNFSPTGHFFYIISFSKAQ